MLLVLVLWGQTGLLLRGLIWDTGSMKHRLEMLDMRHGLSKDDRFRVSR